MTVVLEQHALLCFISYALYLNWVILVVCIKIHFAASRLWLNSVVSVWWDNRCFPHSWVWKKKPKYTSIPELHWVISRHQGRIVTSCYWIRAWPLSHRLWKPAEWSDIVPARMQLSWCTAGSLIIFRMCSSGLRGHFYAPAKEGTPEERTLMRENDFASPSWNTKA